MVGTVFLRSHHLVQEMHAVGHGAANNGGDHQPAALPEKGRVGLVVNRRNRFRFFNGHIWFVNSLLGVTSRISPFRGVI
jgi:hypothetical protein